MHCSQGSWLAQWSRNQQVPLRPLTSYQVNQLHSGLPPHMSWHWPTVTSCTMSRLLSSVMSHVPAVNIPHSSANVVEVEGSEFVVVVVVEACVVVVMSKQVSTS